MEEAPDENVVSAFKARHIHIEHAESNFLLMCADMLRLQTWSLGIYCCGLQCSHHLQQLAHLAMCSVGCLLPSGRQVSHI